MRGGVTCWNMDCRIVPSLKHSSHFLHDGTPISRMKKHTPGRVFFHSKLGTILLYE